MFDPDSDIFKQHVAKHIKTQKAAAKQIIGINVPQEEIYKFVKDNPVLNYHYWSQSSPKKHILNPDDKVDAHVLRTLCKHYSDDVLSIKILTEHDGADEHGFKSNLYTMIIQYTDNNNIYESEWYREEWYDNNIQYYELSKQVKLIGTTHTDQC